MKFVTSRQLKRLWPNEIPARTGVRKTVYPAIKAQANPRRLSFTISTNAVDRDNDVIDPRGIQLANFRKNPVVLLNHDQNDLPIGRAVHTRTVGNSLKSDVEFAGRDLNPKADQVFRMAKAGFLNATSIGFVPLDFRFNERRGGFDFNAVELVEFSIVTVPANPNALLDTPDDLDEVVIELLEDDDEEFEVVDDTNPTKGYKLFRTGLFK